MKIYLAGENGKKRIIGKIVNETIFSGGETRHWLNLPLIEENENATVFGGRILQKYGKRSQADCMGGIVPEVIDEGISCGTYHRRQSLERGQNKTADWGGMGSIDENVPCKPAHDTKIQERAAIRNSPIRGGIPDEVGDENIHSRHSSVCGGGQAEYYSDAIKRHRPYILESFYYADETTEKLISFFGDFLLDSGAFTFMNGFSFTKNEKKSVVWEEYIERYADFINRNNVEKYFELDIDSVVGYDKVLEYRKMLEKLTNKPVIPVWHSTRGLDEYKRSVEEYKYVALGGIVGGEWKKSALNTIPWFISEAHKHGAKIHGLGFTMLSYLEKFHFDSVDSTAWTTGNRFGFIYQFNGKTMIKHQVPKGKRLADSRKVAEINYTEWIKYQRYADKHL